MRGLTSDNFADLAWPHKILDYLWHITLPVTSLVLGSFATSTLLTKNSFLDEIKKSYVQTARMKGLSERRVLYGHVFRNAMLIVIAGFPGAFIGAFFTGSLLIEQVFSLDGLGYLSYDSLIQRDYPVVLGNLYIYRAARPRREPHLRPHLHLDRSAHRFRDARGVRMRRGAHATFSVMAGLDPATVRRRSDAALASRRWRRLRWPASCPAIDGRMVARPLIRRTCVGALPRGWAGKPGMTPSASLSVRTAGCG